MYDPGLYAQLPELKAVADLCLKYDRPLTVHPRANSAVSMSYPQLLGRSHLLRAVDELVEIVGESKLKLHYSHAIFVGRRSFKDKDAFLEIVDRLRKQGIDMMFDIYNETLGVSVITVILPAWYQAMTPEEKKQYLFLNQKKTLDVFLERGAISQAQYDKSLGDLREKMGVKE